MILVVSFNIEFAEMFVCPVCYVVGILVKRLQSPVKCDLKAREQSSYENTILLTKRDCYQCRIRGF
jgi:hypothetical protein